MPFLQPSTSTCYKLRPPEPPPYIQSKKGNDPIRLRYTLNCRTGASIEITRSSVLVHGGLTIPLNLSRVKISEIQRELILYFSKSKSKTSAFKSLREWISAELFSLDLISRVWRHVPTILEDKSNPMQERLFHSIVYLNRSIYAFGGLIVSPENGYALVPTNELWKLDLQTRMWSLVSNEPNIAKRFNHTMAVLHENSDVEDTKIVIIGGLNGLDQPVKYIDVFNVTQGKWETTTDSAGDTLLTNVDGKFVSITADKNSPIILDSEDNGLQTPIAAFYVPTAKTKAGELSGETSFSSKKAPVRDSITGPNVASKVPSRDATPSESQPRRDSTSRKRSDNSIRRKLRGSPLVLLPLHQKSQGFPLCPESSFNSQTIPSNLMYPSCGYINYSIFVMGHSPEEKSTDLHIYVFDFSFNKWTKINVDCPDIDIHKHKFWKLLTWKSHRRVLLLGSFKDRPNILSVQKFDYLLSFGLPILNTLTKKSINRLNSKIVTMLNGGSGSSDSNVDETPFEAFRHPSFATGMVSQFESYIKYITKPQEHEPVGPVFPPYAMVLGKDALEIFGDLLADFEFISCEGESIGVPIYLLRKRWGRYFDRLLSNSYTRATMSHDLCALWTSQSKKSASSGDDVTRSSNPTSTSPKFPSFGLSSSLDGRTSSKTSSAGEVAGSSFKLPSSRLSPTSSLTNIRNLNETFMRDGKRSTGLLRRKAGLTTSSSGGLIFRVPFQDKDTKPRFLESASATEDSPFSEKRRLSLAVAYILSPHTGEVSPMYTSRRRASHPVQAMNLRMKSISDNGTTQTSSSTTATNNNDNDVSTNPESNDTRSPSSSGVSATDLSATSNINGSRRLGLRFPMSSQSSRRPSTISQKSFVSTASFPAVSSFSRKNSFVNLPNRDLNVNGSNNSSINGYTSLFSPSQGNLLSVALPPPQQLPSAPPPPAPATHAFIRSANSRVNSIVEFYGSNKSSPFSSRRPSSLYNIARTTSFQDSIGSLQSLRDSTEESQQSFSPFKRFRQLSWVSVAESTETGGGTSNRNTTTDPMLTPRSLYMPWPTVSVKAFAEFFYTGQVDGKWLLVPVVLDLYIMSKLYEVPLLYDMITDVIYSILGRKVETLAVCCRSMESVLYQRLTKVFDGNLHKVVEFLNKNSAYNDLQKLRTSLGHIDDGFMALSVLKRLSKKRSFSIDTESTEGKSESRYTDGLSSDNSVSSLRPLSSGSLFSKMITGGMVGIPGNLGSSFGSIYEGFKHDGTRRSSLNVLNYFAPEALDGSGGKLDVGREESVLAGGPSVGTLEGNDEFVDSLSHTLEDNVTSVDTRETSEQGSTGIGSNSKRLSAAGEAEQHSHRYLASFNDFRFEYEDKNASDDDNVSTASSESDYNEDIRKLSLTGMSKLLRKTAGFDESVDPLHRISEDSTNDGKSGLEFISKESHSVSNGPTSLGSDKKLSSVSSGSGVSSGVSSRQSNNGDTIFQRESKGKREYRCSAEGPDAVADQLFSSVTINAMDYVVRSIHRTVVLINNPRLVFKCLEYLDVLESLKKIRKVLGEDIWRIEGEKLRRSSGGRKTAPAGSVPSENAPLPKRPIFSSRLRKSAGTVPTTSNLRMDSTLPGQGRHQARTTGSISSHRMTPLIGYPTVSPFTTTSQSQSFQAISPRTSVPSTGLRQR